MARWTTSNDENKHLSDITNQIFTSMGPQPATILLKDGRTIVGRIMTKSIGNNKGQGVPERGWATASVDTGDGTLELDYLDIATVVPGRIN